MQKKIIALAIATAFSAPAFADTTVYGVLDVGYANAAKTIDNTPAATSVKTGEAAFAYSTMTSSRLGFMSTEEVSDGMKVAVKVETGISSNQMAGFSQTGSAAPKTNGTTIDATTLGNRELWTALMLSTGTTIKAGYGSTLVRDISLGYDAAPGGNLVGNLLNNDASLASNRVVGATVAQAFGPVTATVQLSTNTNTQDAMTDSKNGNGYLLGAQYAQGPISAGFAYQSMKTVNAQATTTITLAATGTELTAKTMILAGSYDLGVAKLFAEYANIKNENSLTPAAVGTGKRTYESIGADFPITTAAMVFVQLSKGKNEVATSAVVPAVSRSMSGYTVGGKYNLSKTTYGYASFGNTKLDAGATALDLGVKVSQYTVGIVKGF
jgi:predicted porin